MRISKKVIAALLICTTALYGCGGGGSESTNTGSGTGGNTGGGTGGNTGGGTGGGTGGDTGGGTGGGTTPTVWSLSIAPSSSLVENASATLKYTINPVVDVVVTVEKTAGPSGVSAVVNSGEVVFQVSELENDGTATFNVKAKDKSGVEKTALVTLTLTNSSAASTISLLNAYKRQAQQLVAQSELAPVFANVVTLAQFSAPQSYTATEAQKSLSTLQKDATAKTQMLALLTQDKVGSYTASTITETELKSHATSLVAAYSQYVVPAQNEFKRVLAVAKLPEVTGAWAPAYDPVSSSVSMFVGNNQFGAYENTSWIYKPSYSYIQESITATCSQ